MKRFILTLALLALTAKPAHGVGADLSVAACPGDAAATASAGSLDCAGGGSVALLMTFMPAESYPDLVAVDLVFDLVVDGDVNTNATFWDFASVNAAGLTTHHRAPASGCSDYTDTWDRAGAGSALAAVIHSPGTVRVVALAYRPNTLAVLRNQRLFGIQLVLNTTTAIEAHGVATGCSRSACLLLQQAVPATISANANTPLTTPSVFGNEITINNGSTTMCIAVPAVRHTWGQLKSLYR